MTHIKMNQSHNYQNQQNDRSQNQQDRNQNYQGDRPKNFNFQRTNRTWNAGPNNGSVPNPIVNDSNHVNNVDLSSIGLSNWCRVHSTTSHGESECPEFNAAMKVFQQEIQNMDMTPNNKPSTSQANSNPILVSEMSYKDEDVQGEETSEDGVYVVGPIFEEEVYTTQQQTPQGHNTYNFRPRVNKENATSSRPPNNVQISPDQTSPVNPPPPRVQQPSHAPVQHVQPPIQTSCQVQSQQGETQLKGKKVVEERTESVPPSNNIIEDMNKQRVNMTMYDSSDDEIQQKLLLNEIKQRK